MSVENLPYPSNQPTSYCAIALYSFLYALLRLHHHTRNAFLALNAVLTRIRNSSPNQNHSLKKPTRLQNHLAISGPISSHLDQLANLLVYTVACGTRHLTLYDHRADIDPSLLALFLCQRNLRHIRLSVIGIHKTQSYSSSSHCHYINHHQTCLTEHPNLHQPADIHLTIVKPRTGRAAIARSARVLANQQTVNSPEVTSDDVTRWLDNDEPRCMLPSEPDALVVFPTPGQASIPILNDFPAWQLRLTQIRFSPRPITHVSTEEFSEMVSSAANAPKRFGR